MPAASDAPRIPTVDRFAGAVATRWPGLGRRLADIETRAVRAEIADVRIEKPIYVCGLARAGSTLLLELLAEVPEVTTHRYADFPGLWTPYWWNWLRARLPAQPSVPVERAHRDRIAVTRESPEAFEEMLWMHFFPGRHDPAVDQVMDADRVNADFAGFYGDHLRKLLAVRGARRYLAKANYNLSRIGYLLTLFPDARFVVAIRQPQSHIASLIKQDRLFTQWSRERPDIARQLARTGHFEFGPGKRAINYGDAATAEAIRASFDAGRTVEGYARQWAAAYGWFAARLANDAAFARQCVVVDYGRLCSDPVGTMSAVYAHVDVDATTAQTLLRAQAGRIAAPDYYAADFEPSELSMIQGLTQKVWHSLVKQE